MLRYLIRSIKCLILVGLLFTAIVLIMFYTSDHDPGLKPWDLFANNWTHIIIFFVVYAVVYPLIGYNKKEIAVGGDFASRKMEFAGVLKEINLVPDRKTLEGGAPNILKLHNSSPVIRLLRLWEDTLTLTEKDGIVIMEGQRKDVVRASMKLEYYLQERAEQKEN